MKQFQISRYIKKYSAAILFGSVLAGILVYLLAGRVLQSYVAQTVVKYPEGAAVDTSEIYASNIVTRAVENLGLDNSTVNTDHIRNSIKVTPIVSEDETMLKEAVIQLGEEYTGKPSAYLITYTANVSEGKEFARTMLNEILDVYLNWYGETYANSSGGANYVSDIFDKNYDYIEMMELVEDFLEDSITSIEKKIAIDDTYRSYASGYSFTDLYSEFSYIQNSEASSISADILSDRITRNRDVLLSKYNKRNADMTTQNVASQEEIDNIKVIIDSYVNMMSGSGNTNITSDYILDEVYDSYYKDDKGNVTQGDTTVQYDRLLDGYVDDRQSYEYNLLDIAYNQYVIETFESAPSASSQSMQDEILSRITALVDKLNNLYSIYDVTNDEFNEYLGAKNVTMLSSIGVNEKLPVNLLAVATVFMCVALGCAAAIILGRVGDIMEYYAFTDRTDGLPNRASCDKYLADMSSKLLFGEFSVIVFKITNLIEVNKEYGRESGDKMLKFFARTITDVFTPSDDVFVGNNGSGQYLVFAKGMSEDLALSGITSIDTAIGAASDMIGFDIEYTIGTAEASRDRCYNIRALLSLAMKNSAAHGTNKTVEGADAAAAGLAGTGAGSTLGSGDGSARGGGMYAAGNDGADDSASPAGYNSVYGAEASRGDAYAGDTAGQKAAVNYSDDDTIFALGSDYYSKFRSTKYNSKRYKR